MLEFACKRFAGADPEHAGITQPSQRRYVHYFSRLLQRTLPLGPHPYVFQYMRFNITPDVSSKCGIRPVLRVFSVRPPLSIHILPLTPHWRGVVYGRRT
jgi:tensin